MNDYIGIRRGVQGFIERDRRFLNKQMTETVISENIDKYFSVMKDDEKLVDKQELTDDLLRRYTVKETERIKTLVGDSNQRQHKEWLEEKRDKINWRQWDRYKEMLLDDFPGTMAQNMDEYTDKILSNLEDPTRVDEPWDSRGLVLGHVQSGKTANYIGLANKAADAGYKLIIVLTGMQDDLRSQTQVRFDEGYLGFISNRQDLDAFMDTQNYGVSKYDPSRFKPNCGTSRLQKGDFNRRVSENFITHPSNSSVLLVIKKIKPILDAVLSWINNWGEDFAKDVPLLLIDDECDLASVDTGKQEFLEDPLTGVITAHEDYQPRVINSRIRKILMSCNRRAYVAYTATPYANIFIHYKGHTKEEGLDLYPKDYIVMIPPPTDYWGPEQLFSCYDDDDPKLKKYRENFIVPVEDHADDPEYLKETKGWAPPKHLPDHIPLYKGADEIPPSLENAIYNFILVCCVRRIRNKTKPHHNSMLVHVSRFINVNKKIEKQIVNHVNDIRNKINYQDSSIKHSFLSTWKDVVSKSYEKSLNPKKLDLDFNEVYDLTENILNEKKFKIMRLTGESDDSLKYDKYKEDGLNVIALGGISLSRGMTLDGLSISYFLRRAQIATQDTMTQMGRWFGYRPQYEDLCKLYTANSTAELYQNFCMSEVDVREQFSYMEEQGLTPQQFGAKLEKGRGFLQTARAKMKHAAEVWISYDGYMGQTTKLKRDETSRVENLKVFKNLLNKLKNENLNPIKSRPKRNVKFFHVFKDISSKDVCAFLRSYQNPDVQKVQPELFANYIEEMVEKNNELTDWTVAIPSGESEQIKIGEYYFKPPIRTHKENRSTREFYGYNAVVSGFDEAIDLSDEEYQLAKQKFKDDKKSTLGPIDGEGIRRVRPKNRGLMVIYILKDRPCKNGCSICQHSSFDPKHLYVSIMVSFPQSQTAIQRKYLLNSVAAQKYFSGEMHE